MVCMFYVRLRRLQLDLVPTTSVKLALKLAVKAKGDIFVGVADAARGS